MTTNPNPEPDWPAKPFVLGAASGVIGLALIESTVANTSPAWLYFFAAIGVMALFGLAAVGVLAVALGLRRAGEPVE